MFFTHLSGELLSVAVRLHGPLLELRVFPGSGQALRRADNRSLRREGLRSLGAPLEVGDLLRPDASLLRQVIYNLLSVVALLPKYNKKQTCGISEGWEERAILKRNVSWRARTAVNSMGHKHFIQPAATFLSVGAHHQTPVFPPPTLANHNQTRFISRATTTSRSNPIQTKKLKTAAFDPRRVDSSLSIRHTRTHLLSCGHVRGGGAGGGLRERTRRDRGERFVGG